MSRLNLRRLHAALSLAMTALLLAMSLSGCVVSTYGGPDAEPDIPVTTDKTSRVAPTQTIVAGPTQVGARHILISFRGATRAAPYIERSKDEARTFAEQLRLQAEAGEDFSALARKHSDDRGSAATGGDLGLFRREQMVPEFSEAAFALEVGKISAVVESQFGFHVIQRTE